jgi:hypothetical protein
VPPQTCLGAHATSSIHADGAHSSMKQHHNQQPLCPASTLTSRASVTLKPVASWSSTAVAAGPKGGTSLHQQRRQSAGRWHGRVKRGCDQPTGERHAIDLQARATSMWLPAGLPASHPNPPPPSPPGAPNALQLAQLLQPAALHQHTEADEPILREGLAQARHLAGVPPAAGRGTQSGSRAAGELGAGRARVGSPPMSHGWGEWYWQGCQALLGPLYQYLCMAI